MPRMLAELSADPDSGMRGYRLVFDYRAEEHGMGQTASHGGAIQVEGRWYCPSMPAPLVNATKDHMLRKESDPEWIDYETYKKRIEQRTVRGAK